MCEASWVFPTPKLGRYLIRTGFDFFFFWVLFGLNFNFCYWANIFFIAFKNINNIVKGGKVQFYWNKLLKIIYYIYTKKKFWKSGGGHCPPRSTNSSVSALQCQVSHAWGHPCSVFTVMTALLMQVVSLSLSLSLSHECFVFRTHRNL